MLFSGAVLVCGLQTAAVLDREDMSYSGGVRQGLLAMFAKTTRPNVKINKGEMGRKRYGGVSSLFPLGLCPA